MADNFDIAIKQLLEDEGEKIIVDDHGRGASKYGITLKTAQETHPDWTPETITSLTPQMASDWYRVYYWMRYHFDRIENPELASKVFNFGVNVGAGTSIRLLQRLIGFSEPTSGHTPSTPELDIIDGILGPATAAKVNASDASELLEKFKEGAADYHKKVAEDNPELAGNLEGWLRRDEA